MNEGQNIPRDDVLVLPADLVGEAADGAVLAAGLQSQDTEGLGNNHLLLLVVRGRDTLEDLESLESGGTAGGLVGNHATDGLVEDPGRGAEVEGTTAGRVVTGHLAEVGVVLDCWRVFALAEMPELRNVAQSLCCWRLFPRDAMKVDRQLQICIEC